MKNAFRNIKCCWTEVRKLQSKYVIVKYLRLSIEDGDSAESDSIKSQRSLLDTHISFKFRDRKYEVIELIDDGYTGKLIAGKFKKAYVGSKKVIPVPEDEIVVVENTHEAIISQELFNEVQKKRICKKRIQRKTSLFGGFLRCGNCGRTLSYSSNDEKKRRYYCRFYNISGNMECLHDSITYKEVVEVVSKAVKAELTRAADIAKMKAKLEENSKIYRGKLQQMQQSIKGLSRKKAECYIKLTKGEIDEAEFLKTKHNIEMQVDIYKADIQKQEEKSLSLEETSVLNLFEKYIGINELTNEMLSDIIKAIYVYTGKRIKIVWNFRERLNECV